MLHETFFDQVYSRDQPVEGKPHGWIQWEGTNVCIDLHCECGEHSHMDADFLYYWQCKCGRKYALGPNVLLIPLTDKQAEYVEKECNGFQTSLEESKI